VQLVNAGIFVDNAVQTDVSYILRVGLLWPVELPCAVIDVMEYASNRVFTTHYAFGGKYACLRVIAEFPVVTVCCFGHPASIAFGAAGRLALSVVVKSPFHSSTPPIAGLRNFIPRPSVKSFGLARHPAFRRLSNRSIHRTFWAAIAENTSSLTPSSPAGFGLKPSSSSYASWRYAERRNGFSAESPRISFLFYHSATDLSPTGSCRLNRTSR
jgi:hypothetical protein